MSIRDKDSKTVGKPGYAYSEHEVIEFRDKDHTPYNKRPCEVASVLNVQFRSPLGGDWISIHTEETTTTPNYNGGKDRTQSRVINFTMTREMFAAIVAHVNREKNFE